MLLRHQSTATKGLLLVSCAVVLRTAAGVFVKFAALMAQDHLVEGIASPAYVAALACLFTQSLVWVAALRIFPLRTAYPFLALSIPLSLSCAAVLFGERVGLLHVVGATFIVLGVVLSAPRRGDADQ